MRCLGGICGACFVVMVITLFYESPFGPFRFWPQWGRVSYFTLLCIFVVVFLWLFIGSFSNEMNLNAAILAVTAWILLWYTLETYVLRWEMVEQTKQMAQQSTELRRQIDLQMSKGVLAAGKKEIVRRQQKREKEVKR